MARVECRKDVPDMTEGREETESALRRAADLLGLRRSVVAVLAVVLLVDLG